MDAYLALVVGIFGFGTAIGKWLSATSRLPMRRAGWAIELGTPFSAALVAIVFAIPNADRGIPLWPAALLGVFGVLCAACFVVWMVRAETMEYPPDLRDPPKEQAPAEA